MATRLNKFQSMDAEQVAQVLMDSDLHEYLPLEQHFCKDDCEGADSLDGPDEKDCLECCVRWLNEEVA